MVAPTPYDLVQSAAAQMLRAMVLASADERREVLHVVQAFATGILMAGDESPEGVEAAASRLLAIAREAASPQNAARLAGRRLALVADERVADCLDVRGLINDLLDDEGATT